MNQAALLFVLCLLFATACKKKPADPITTGASGSVSLQYSGRPAAGVKVTMIGYPHTTGLLDKPGTSTRLAQSTTDVMGAFSMSYTGPAGDMDSVFIEMGSVRSQRRLEQGAANDGIALIAGERIAATFRITVSNNTRSPLYVAGPFPLSIRVWGRDSSYSVPATLAVNAEQCIRGYYQSGNDQHSKDSCFDTGPWVESRTIHYSLDASSF